METRNATEILEMFHFAVDPQCSHFHHEKEMRHGNLRNVPFHAFDPQCSSYNIVQHGNLQVYQLLFRLWKSSKCSISCVRSAVLLQWYRFTWKSSNLTNFFSHSCKTYHFHHKNATEILEMFHFMRSIRSTPPMTSFNMEIFKSTNFFSFSCKTYHFHHGN